MRPLKSIILAVVIFTQAAYSADMSILQKEVNQIMEVANDRGVGTRVAYLISSILMEESGILVRQQDLGYQLLFAERNVSIQKIPYLLTALSTNPEIQAELVKPKKQIQRAGVEYLPMSKKFGYELPESLEGKYRSQTSNADYIAELRNGLGLVGVHLISDTRTVAIREVAPDAFQFVSIQKGTYAMPDEVTEVSGEFSKAELAEVSKKIKTELKRNNGDMRWAPGLNLSGAAVSAFVSAGTPGALVGLGIAGVALAIDVVTSPVQLSLWAWEKTGQKVRSRQLAKRSNLESNDVVQLTSSQLNRLQFAMAVAHPVSLTARNKCIRFYK